MKKLILSLGIVAVSTTFCVAQSPTKQKTLDLHTAQQQHADDHNHDHAGGNPHIKDNGASNMKPENMVFNEDSHDFGTIPEGPAAEYEFKFKNTGSEPIVITKVHASCGCTTPSYSKEPVKPGETGTVKAVYNTQGRPTPFNKSITVVSNAGTKVLVIKGTVEKAPDGSVPKNTSMMKMN